MNIKYKRIFRELIRNIRNTKYYFIFRFSRIFHSIDTTILYELLILKNQFSIILIL